MRWSLDSLYKGFGSTELQADFEKVKNLVEILNEFSETAFEEKNAIKIIVKNIENYIQLSNDFASTFGRMNAFASLTKSVDNNNTDASTLLDKLEDISTKTTKPRVIFSKWILSLENKIDEIIKSSKIISAHEFMIREIIENGKYLLSEEEELVISKMKTTGSKAWTKLVNTLTSTHLVEIDVKGKLEKLPLPAVRNMAYDSDKNVRKNAYEAEKKSYSKITEGMASCLNSIKGEVITLSNLRGYESPLHMSIQNMRMEKKTLDAMFASMKKAMPLLQKYLQKKSKLLGNEGFLPFYDLFAPLGKVEKKYSFEEAHSFIVENFNSYSKELGDLADRAFKEKWIDAEPREGKRGGAFCNNIIAINESRVMANYDGSFSNVTTLAHELGHAYHGYALRNEYPINTSYRMQVAETASIFCETIVMEAAKKKANNDEKLALLEAELSDATQVIMDIYSRFLFEYSFFEKRKERSLSVKEINELMLNAQKEAYGDGLDKNYLHEYMWVCKPHYYSADVNFYNWPYAFGLLFSKGLYAMYLEKGEKFIPIYNELLARTGKMKAEDVAKSVGIDITKEEFWDKSMSQILKNVDEFLKL